MVDDALRRSKDGAGAPAKQLNRERLLALDNGEPILVVEAPPGYGKTVLARAWLRAAPKGTRAAWISLDQRARDPAIFIDRIAEALSGLTLKHAEAGPDNEAVRAERFALLTDQLSASAEPLRLVFDDAHYLAESESRHYLRRLLLGANERLRLFITMQPQALDVGFGALTAQHKVRWINAAALVFTREEIDSLARLRGLALQSEHLDWLLRVTEGWPVLIQVALAAPLDPGLRIPANIEELGPLREYIYERFLTRLTTAEQDMIWAMTCVGTAPLSLLRSMLAAKDADEIISHLSSLGIVQTFEPEDSPSVRLHPIVRKAAARLLASGRQHGKTELQVAAAHWYWKHGAGTDAAHLLLDAGPEYLETVRAWLIELATALIFSQGQHQTLLDLVDQWERVAQHSDPALDRIAIWALIFLRRFDAAKARLERCAVSTPPLQSEGEERLQLAVMAALRDDYGDAGGLVFEWLQHHRQEMSFHSGAAWTVYGFHLKCAGDIAGAQAALREAARTFDRLHSGYGASWAHVVSAVAWVKAGHHRDALAEIERGLEVTEKASGLHGQRAMLRGMEAFLRYERNELSVVHDALDEALPLLADQGIVDTMILGFTAAARLRAATGQFGAALDILSEGERCGQQRDFPRLSITLVAERALVLARSGATSQALYAAKAAGIVPEASGSGLVWDRASRLFARLAVADGESERALQLLVPLVAHARAAHQRYKLCELLVLTALAQDLCGNEADSQDALGEALELGSAEHYLRVFLDEGPELHALLRRWLGKKRAGLRNELACSWASSIVTILDGAENKPRATDHALIASLNRREQQIVSLLDQGLSNAQIAARCFLGEGTVKWHLHNLYGKLGVRSRTAALRMARERGLLDS